jgi:SHS2 domain-containing protein
MPYEFLEDAATADIAFTARGKSVEEVFIAAADALINVMVEDLDSIQPRARLTLALENDQLEMLLFNFLQEFIYYKDAENLILRAGEVHIVQENKQYTLGAVAAGETLDPQRHHTRADVKAVTLHQFRLEQTDHGWEASVILDI